MKKLYETFEKLNQRLDDCKLEKKCLNLPKSDEIDEQTYRIQENLLESRKMKKMQCIEDFEDLKKRKSNQSDVEIYLDKYALNFDKLKDEEQYSKEIHPSTKGVAELLERLHIRDIGFQNFDELEVFEDLERSPKEKFEESRTVNQESQFTNRMSLEEKEKIVKRLLSGKSEGLMNIEKNRVDSFSKSQELKKEDSKPQIPNLMSRMFKSDYLRQDVSL